MNPLPSQLNSIFCCICYKTRITHTSYDENIITIKKPLSSYCSFCEKLNSFNSFFMYFKQLNLFFNLRGLMNAIHQITTRSVRKRTPVAIYHKNKTAGSKSNPEALLFYCFRYFLTPFSATSYPSTFVLLVKNRLY